MQNCFMLTSTVLLNIIKQLWAAYGINARLITLREQNRPDKSLCVLNDIGVRGGGAGGQLPPQFSQKY